MGSHPLRASVLIVEYATGRHLPECLRALLKSTLSPDDFEVIVVDNASPTPVGHLASQFPAVRFLTSRRNLGFAGGNRLALSYARGTHVVLLNPDAIPAPEWLAAVLSPLRDPAIGIVGSRILHPGTDIVQHMGGVLRANALSDHVGRGQRDRGQWSGLVDAEYVSGAALALKREVIDQVGFLSPVYHPAYFEETELCVRARRAGFRVVVAPDARVEHHEAVASGGARARAYLRRYHESRLRFVLRNYGGREMLMRFLPAEASWFLRWCPPFERRICLAAYLRAPRSAWDGSRGEPSPEDVVEDSWRGQA